MRKQVFNLFVAVTISVSVVAQPGQTQESYTFNLQQCIDFALKSNVNVKNAILDQQASAAKIKEVRGSGFPQINGSIGFQHANPLRAFYGEVGSSPFLTPGANGLTQNDVGRVVSFPNFFQLKNSGDMSVTIDQLILSSTYIIGLEAAKLYKDLIARTTDVTKIRIVEGVSKAYFNALVVLERKSILEKNIKALDSLYFVAKESNKVGLLDVVEVDRLQVQINNLVTQQSNIENYMALATIALKYNLGMPLESELILTERLTDYKPESIVLPEDDKVDLGKAAEFSLSKQLVLLAKKDYALTSWGRLPTLGGSINFGWFTQNKEFDFWKTNNGWSNYATYSIGLKVPIFDGLSSHYQGQQKKVSLLKAENNLKDTEIRINTSIKSSKLSFQNATTTLKFQQKNIELAEKVVKSYTIKYKGGIGSSTDLIQADQALYQAQSAYLDALFNVLISKVEYERATGILK